MSNHTFFTRPHFEDRQHVQYSGDVITLSGQTKAGHTGKFVVLPTILDFTGTTTASTTTTINGLTGYLNVGRENGLQIYPPVLKLSGTTGTTTVDVTGYVLKARDAFGNIEWGTVASLSADTNTFVTGGTLSGTDLILGWNTGGSASPVDLSALNNTFTGNTSGSCITDLYITNLYGCSPITIHDNLQNVTSSALTGTYTNVFGNSNKVTDTYSAFNPLVSWSNSILGGYNNTINSVYNSVIVGGVGNSILRPALAATYSGNFIGAGTNNTIYATYGYNFIGAGVGNEIAEFSSRASIVGGVNNYNYSSRGFIGGGSGNRMEGQITDAFIGAGYYNTIISNYSSIIGGRSNTIGNFARNAVIGGGRGNTMGGSLDGVHYSFIGGGYNNTITGSSTQYSFIGAGAGHEIKDSKASSIVGGGANYIYAGGYNIITNGKGSQMVGSHSSSIIGGNNHVLNSLDNTVILGGVGVTATTSNTTYVPYLNISNIGTGTSINNLGIDANGEVVVGTAGGGGGVTIDPYYTEPSNTTFTWDVSGTSTNYQTVLTGNTTLNLDNVRNGDYGTLIVQQDGVGSHTLSFGTVNGAGGTHRVVNGGGGSPTLTSNPNAIDILSFTYNGSVMYWTVGNDYT
jgi:hypothetical protein